MYKFCTYISFIFLLIQVPKANGQTTQQQRNILLTEALTHLGERHGIRFAYDKQLVMDKKVLFSLLENNWPLEVSLNRLLESHGLTYLKVGSTYYTIQRATQKNIPITTPLPSKRTVTGTVRLQGTQTPVSYASLQLVELAQASQSDQNGRFIFGKLSPGKYTLQIRSISIVPKEIEFSINEKIGDIHLDVEVQLNRLDLDEVHVTAQEQKSRGATMSLIESKAIEHLQATSLSDVLQLVPGNLMNNPSLTSVNRVSLRQIGTDNMGSLGTALYINGAPVSNNVNMQLSGLPNSGVLGSYQTTAGSGVDFRHFTADNIESVEVIRGIPSVEYGDITSGAIVVKTKTGKSPLNTKLRITPTIFQVAGSKGLDLGRQAGLLNIDLDYTRAVSDQRFDVNTFDRYTVNLQHEKRFRTDRPLLLTSNLTYRANIGQQKLDPDDEAETFNYAKDYNYRINVAGKWNLGYRFANNLNFQVSLDYSEQHGYQQSLVGGSVYPIATSMTPTEAVPVKLVPGLYLSQTSIEGKPLNLFMKVTDNFTLQTGPLSHRILLGAEWRTENNNGQGKQYDPERPPRLGSSASTRERSYGDIPALHMLSLYAENHIQTTLWNRKLTFLPGIRFDNIQPDNLWQSKIGTILSPRINASYALSDRFQLRGGYGITAKAPTLAYLYPQQVYYDYIVLNHYTDNPAERLVLATTRIFDRENTDLKIAYNTKKEIGISFRPNWANISATAYHEVTRNGYEYMETLESLQRTFVNRYQVQSINSGTLPTIDPVPVGVDTLYTDYTVPTNGRRNTNKGIEFDFDFGRILSLRTSFMLNGAWMQSRTESTNPYIVKQSVSGASTPNRVGIYATGRGNLQERLNTTLRIIHNIPEFRLVASLAIQTVWIDRHRYIGYDRIAQGYFSKQNGEVYWFTENERSQLDHTSLADREVALTFSDEYFLTESWKPRWLFNLRLTKEIGDQMGFSFFANNLFMHNPLEQSTRWSNQYSRRNPGFLFGAEMNIKF
ncbi:MAG: TonB-dependent receptor domain-containing protein [Sphingobacterium sp.]